MIRASLDPHELQSVFGQLGWIKAACDWTYPLLKETLHDGRVHGLVLVHLAYFRCDYLSREALD